MKKNPISFPKSFEEINDDGSRTAYRTSLIQGKDIRLIEYYDKKGLITRVIPWGICRPLIEEGNRYVARDEEIDFNTGEQLKPDIKAKYLGVEISFC